MFPLLTRHRENCLCGIPLHLSLKVHPISAAGATNKEQPTNQHEHGYTVLQLYHVISEKNCFSLLSQSFPCPKKVGKKWHGRNGRSCNGNTGELHLGCCACPRCPAACSTAPLAAQASAFVVRPSGHLMWWEWRWERAMWKKWWV